MQKKDYYLLRLKEAEKLEQRFPRLQRIRLHQNDYTIGTLTYLFYANADNIAYFYMAEYAGIPMPERARITCRLVKNPQALKQSLGSCIVNIDSFFMFHSVLIERMDNVEKESANIYLSALGMVAETLGEDKSAWLEYFVDEDRWVYHLANYGLVPILYQSEYNKTAQVISDAAKEARRLLSMSRYVGQK